MNSDDLNDADLNAFLQSDDELSRQLQSLSQREPSSALDAAILAHATLQVASKAANDPAPAGAHLHAVRALGRLSARWTVPAGIAATLLVGVLARQSWQASVDAEVAQYGAPAPAAALKKAPVNAAPEALPTPTPTPTPTSTPTSLAPPPPPSPKVRLPGTTVHDKLAEPSQLAEITPEPQRELVPLQFESDSFRMTAPAPKSVPVPAPLQAYSSQGVAGLASAPQAPQKSAPAPSLELTPNARSANEVETVISADIDRTPDSSLNAASGVLSRVAPPAANLRFSAPKELRKEKAPAVTSDKQADVWLALIDEMFKAGLHTEALDEWTRFRHAHPAYPVPDPLSATINAQLKAKAGAPVNAESK